MPRVGRDEPLRAPPSRVVRSVSDPIRSTRGWDGTAVHLAPPRDGARRPPFPRGTAPCASLVVIHPCNQSRHGIIDSRESGRVAPNSPNHSPNQKGWLQFSTIGRTSGFSLAVFMDTGPRPWSPSSNARLRRTTSCRHNTESSDNGKLATLDHSGFLRCVALPKP